MQVNKISPNLNFKGYVNESLEKYVKKRTQEAVNDIKKYHGYVSPGTVNLYKKRESEILNSFSRQAEKMDDDSYIGIWETGKNAKLIVGYYNKQSGIGVATSPVAKFDGLDIFGSSKKAAIAEQKAATEWEINNQGANAALKKLFLMSKNLDPKASNGAVLQEYSTAEVTEEALRYLTSV